MRRLRVLPCPESWERMREDVDDPGRFCERCQLHVTEVAKLDGDGLEQLVGAAGRGRVCARFELEDGRPRTKLGLAAGLAVIVLAGCATPSALAPQIPITRAPEAVEEDDRSERTGEIDPANANAIVLEVIVEPPGSPRRLPVGAQGIVTGAVAIDDTVHFDSGFVSAGLRVGE